METLLPLIFLAAVVLVPLIYLVVTYNRFVRLGQHIREAWADIDVELKRRHDLIPNLVETVKGYAAHERQVLERIVELRNRAESDRGAADRRRDLVESETQIGRELGRIFALVENYPQLKSDAHFRQLQEELALTEDRLAAARRFYNGNVREMNNLVRSVPSNLVAGMFKFGEAEYFEVDTAERAVSRVGF